MRWMIWASLWCVDGACVSSAAIIARWYTSVPSPAPDLWDCRWSALVSSRSLQRNACARQRLICHTTRTPFPKTWINFIYTLLVLRTGCGTISHVDNFLGTYSRTLVYNWSFFNWHWVNFQLLWLLCKQKLDVEIRNSARDDRERMRKVNLSSC